MAIKSKSVTDYFEAGLDQLRSDEAVPFAIYLYFPNNKHIILWVKKDQKITSDFREKYLNRGIKGIWIHQDDLELFQKYLEGNAELLPDASEEDDDVKKNEPDTAEGAAISEVLNSDELNEEEKEALAAEVAQNSLAEALDADDEDAQKEADEKAKKIVEDVLSSTISDADNLIDEIMKIADVDPDLNHGVNVSTYAVLFAMAFGRIDRELLGDLALAGLLHDIGLSQIPIAVVQKPWTEQKGDLQAQYQTHVGESMSLVDSLTEEGKISPRVKAIIHQHHEKFDGTGYPQNLRGFNIDDVAALLAMAETLDSIASGQWDGKKRTRKETLDELYKMEKARTFPEHFNPEIFAAVMRWVGSEEAEKAMQDVADVVKEKASDVLATEEDSSAA